MTQACGFTVTFEKNLWIYKSIIKNKAAHEKKAAICGHRKRQCKVRLATDL